MLVVVVVVRAHDPVSRVVCSLSTSGDLEWCVCQRCQVETKVEKQVCCGESPAGCLSVALAQELVDVVSLVDADLVTHGACLTGQRPPNIAQATPVQKRLLCYRKLFRVVHGIGTTNVQVPLASCCRAIIDQAYPN